MSKICVSLSVFDPSKMQDIWFFGLKIRKNQRIFGLKVGQTDKTLIYALVCLSLSLSKYFVSGFVIFFVLVLPFFLLMGLGSFLVCLIFLLKLLYHAGRIAF